MSHSTNSFPRSVVSAETAKPFSAAEVSALLAGGPDTADQAVGLIEQHLHKRMASWLRQHFSELSAQDREDIWSEALLGVWQAARQGRYRDKPLFPWLCVLVRARGIDLVRKRAFEERKEHLARDLARAASKRPHRSAVEVSDALAAVDRAIPSLTRLQQAVVRAFVENFPASRKTAVLRPLASRLAGRDLTIASVRRALQDARCALRTMLRQQGLLPASLAGP